MTTTVVLATRNRHKIDELRVILAGLAVDVALTGIGDYSDVPEVAETGATFAENAVLKARAVAAATGVPALADDSGLCVDALNGMPGVLSARWSGRHGSDVANVDLVLDQLADVPDDRLGAFFACAAALALPEGQVHVVEGTIEGHLVRVPRGTNGFGYDPIFVPEGDTLTLAETPTQRKNAISHRARAFTALAPVLRTMLA